MFNFVIFATKRFKTDIPMDFHFFSFWAISRPFFIANVINVKKIMNLFHVSFEITTIVFVIESLFLTLNIKTDLTCDVYLLDLMYENHVVDDNKMRPCPCKQCPKSFSWTSDLKEHVKYDTWQRRVFSHEHLKVFKQALMDLIMLYVFLNVACSRKQF